MDGYLKNNLDNYFIPAVVSSWDGVALISGLEGSGKSTIAMSLAKYVDPTFPGELIHPEKNTKRYCDRIVFTPKQFVEVIDKASPGQCIVFDEAIMGFMAADASTEIQKALIKKMVTIRKKRLYIFIVLPSIFLLRMYMAIFRTRFLIHAYTPDGVQRGFFKFYSYETKRKLYVDGKRDFNQDACSPDFKGRFTNTNGLFFPLDEYEAKKDEAIRSITTEPDKKGDAFKNKEYILKGQRDLVVAAMYRDQRKLNPRISLPEFAEALAAKCGSAMKFSGPTVSTMIKNAEEFLQNPDPEEIKRAKKNDELLDKVNG